MDSMNWKVFAEKLKKADADTRKKIENILDRLLAEQENTKEKKKP